MKSLILALAAIGLSAGLIGSADAQPAQQSGLPPLAFSIVERQAGGVANGPRFQLVKRAIEAANEGNGAGLQAALSPDAELKLFFRRDGERTDVPLSAEVIRTIEASCAGPYSHNEGAAWAQLSWICPTDGSGALARTMTFQDNPELTVTVWFEGDRIERIHAREAFMIPMQRRAAMDAFDHIPPERR